MAKSKESVSRKRGRPATTPEAREQQLIALAFDQAERDLREGKASSQVITYFLKAGSEKYKLENDKLKTENGLLKAKIESLESSKRIEELYEDAINAMKRYRGE